MRYINLDSLIEATINLTTENSEKYLEFLGIKFENDEIQDLSNLLGTLKENGLNNTDNYFVGYTIQQISKQFDLLRIGEDSVVNIELKRTSTREKIKKQLIQNKYYLKFIGVTVHTFTYVSETNELFILDKTNNLVSINPQVLIDTLHSQVLLDIKDIDSLFKPSNYLVSPFNSTDKFIVDEYFLTEHQNNIKTNIINTFSSPTPEFVSITGKPGTGKTLMTYDIAKIMRNSGLDVIIVHCGKLNQGHQTLSQQYGWRIYSIKEYSRLTNLNFNAIIVDEAQRLHAQQVGQIKSDVIRNNANCLFSYDPDQCLTHSEAERNIDYFIKLLTQTKNHKLTEKIRTNKEIASFIVTLFDLNKTNPTQDYKNINIQYFDDERSAKNYASELSFNGWEVINFTNSLHYRVTYDDIQPPGNKNSHDVIGQEFDKVAVFIDHHFYYNNDKKLEANNVANGAYSIDKMLYQNLTRTREELHIIIVRNQPMLSVILDILTHKVPVTV